MLDEQQLVRRAQADPAQFVHLYDRYVQRIYAFVRRESADVPSAEDIVATTFEKALRNLPHYEDRGVSFGAWLYKIARNEVRRHHNKGRWLAPLRDWLPSKLDVEQTVGERVAVGRITQIAQTLSKRDQEILRLHFYEQLSHAEVAAVLGCTQHNAAVRLSRALARLRNAVEVNEHEQTTG